MIDLSAQCRQVDFGELVGISQPAVSDLLMRGVLTDGAAAGQWLREYCGHMREIAAGRFAAGDIDLATERALLAREQREKIAMQNAVTRGELAPRALLTQVLAAVAPRVCGLLESIVPALRRRSGYSAEDLDFVARTIADARNAIADLRLPDLLADVAEDDADDPADTEDSA